MENYENDLKPKTQIIYRNHKKKHYIRWNDYVEVFNND